MADLFVYGTLRFRPLLRTVLGREPAGLEARLPGHRVAWAEGQTFPLIEAAGGHSAAGLLLPGLSEDDIARLDFYEGGFAYDLRPVTVETEEGARAAQVYFPQPGTWTGGADWSLDSWVAEHGDFTLLAAGEAMSRFGELDAAGLQRAFPFIRARAAAMLRARTPQPARLRADFGTDAIAYAPLDGGYDGFFRLQRFAVSHRTYEGGQSDRIEREAFVAFDAALVLPYDPGSDRVVLIEQLRYGPVVRGDPRPWVLEPIAGLVDAGETPEEAAIREAQEEAHIALDEVRPMTRVYASPGYSTEFFHCFVGLCDLSDREGGLGGLDAENEDIRYHVLPFPEAMELLDSGEVNAGPLAMMLLWLHRERDGLRPSA